ncbi:MAG: c-type cytochrome [Nitrospinota bacterium]
MGKRLYQSICATCHGKNGKTAGALAVKLGLTPPDLTSNRYQKKDAESLARIIGSYKPGQDHGMPKWNETLAKSNLRNIAAYIISLTKKDLLIKADLKRGMVIYGNACASCHGRHGKGDGILASALKVKMMDYSKGEGIREMTDRRLVEIIRDGGSELMPGWKGTLNDDEIIDVVAYIRTFLP